MFQRSKEHGWNDKKSAVFLHLSECEGLRHIDALMSFPDNDSDPEPLPLSEDAIRLKCINNVRDNLSVIDKSDNWSILLTKEALAIKERKPLLNCSLKASSRLVTHLITVSLVTLAI